ncbi:MAG: hypothetical protein LBQ36_04500 [Synergistaceae bacterium]|nr:hypothetical protein [Synergistaceae bacterium]
MRVVFGRIARIAAFTALASMFAAAGVPANGATAGKEVEKLMPARTVTCWFDADRIDELILNARGKLTFLMVDGKLGGALKRLNAEKYRTGGMTDIPDNIFQYASKYNARKKHVLLVARVQALKLWAFDSEKISVNGYSPAKEDIITGISSNPFEELRHGAKELAKGYNGFIGFFVPSDYLKQGAEIAIGYDGYVMPWKVPSENQ